MPDEDEKYLHLRKQMIENQIIRRGINDPKILKALLKVKRHHFVPKNRIREAYKDHPVPIGAGQTISQPYIVAFMSEKLSVKSHHKVLEVGTGCGYQTAILCELAKQVYTIELIEELGIKAAKILQELKYSNFQLKIDNAYGGWDKFAPFDRIMVTCAPEYIPHKLIEQLAENGKMIIPAGKKFNQELFLIDKHGSKISKKHLLSVRFVPMKHSIP